MVVDGIVLVVVLGTVSFLVRAAALSKGGLNPLASKEELEVKLAQRLDQTNAEPPRKTLEERWPN